MLVFISDLHIDDMTAGVQFLPPKAFHGALKDIAKLATDARSKEVILVFLGDIFDLVRTTGWFQVEEQFRPWGMPEANPDEEAPRYATFARHGHEWDSWNIEM